MMKRKHLVMALVLAGLTVTGAERAAAGGAIGTPLLSEGISLDLGRRDFMNYCAACHGVDGNAAIALYPKLAGQHEQYIWRQLKMYKSGERNNAIMLGLAAVLTEQDMRDIGAYFSQQKVIAGLADETVIAQGPNAGKKFYEVGEKIYRSGNATNDVPACMACHGPAGAGMPGPTYPALGGQHADYTSLRLNEFRAGTVWGKDKNANVIMSQAAKGLSDEDIQSLATYLQGLHKASKPAKK